MKSGVPEHEVTVLQQDMDITVEPPNSADSLLDLGSDPIWLEIDDASVNHDDYVCEGVSPSTLQPGGGINSK